MKVAQLRHKSQAGWTADAAAGFNPQLVLAFGEPDTILRPSFYQALIGDYPDAEVVIVSAPHSIAASGVLEGEGSATLVRFDNARIVTAATDISAATSESAGHVLAEQIVTEGLRHVLVFSEGLNVNGTALIRGLSNALPQGVTVTGGLASDGERFQQTLVGLNETPKVNRAVVIGLCGEALDIGIGSLGGWVPFGSEMTVTRSDGNVVYELDDSSALDVYRKLLGPRAFALPASGLLFPLSVQSAEGKEDLVRTMLAVDPATGSVSFAGDVPEGSTVRVMAAELDHLIEASGNAARSAARGETGPELALLVSCIGRKLLLQLRTHEEVEAARRIFGESSVFTGFYSYGEVSPASDRVECRLQNQTMTITSISERTR